MPFEWLNKGCLRRLFETLKELGVPIKVRVVEACEFCENGNCESKPMGFTPQEIFSGKSAFELRAERKVRLEDAQKRREKEARDRGYW